MPLKAQDLQTFEAYKKAIRASASQIKDNTPFCLYSDVEIPDASKKSHMLRPFLVVGSPATAITPMLKDLHGGRKLSCSGLCSLENGKIRLEAKSGAVNFGLFKSQATVFKDLLGKDILIPAAGGAPAAKPADVKPDPGPVETINTPYGSFTYFANEKAASAALIKTLEKVLENIEGASDDGKALNAAYDEARKMEKALPNASVILDWCKKADRASADEARQAKMAYLIFDEFRGKLSDLAEDAQDAGQSVSAALDELNSQKLQDEADQLKAKAEEEKEIIEGVFKVVKLVVKVGEALVDPAKAGDLLMDCADYLVDIGAKLATANLVQKAAQCEAMAKELKAAAAAARFSQAKDRVASLSNRQVQAMNLLKRAQALVQSMSKVPMKGFDETTKGPFKFQDLEDLADRITEVRDQAQDIIKESRLAFDASGVLIEMVASGKWKSPKLDDNKKILQKIKDEAVNIGKMAGVRYHECGPWLASRQKVYAQAQEAVAKAHS